MRITLEVTGAGEALDLREWLRGDPELRDRVGRVPAQAPEPGAMGGLGELVALLLEPGGLTVTLAASVVAWLQTRKGSQTVTITKPDGTQVVVTSEGVRGLTPESSGELAERVAQALRAPAPPPPPAPPTTDGATGDRGGDADTPGGAGTGERV
ncbi:hypothetical protein ACFY8W_09180 [Streptomyces sp. NPDC012637]|uniref:effector-associated constant component EACC1 n=1 Tax=Streptomyces sp. NPDC012637 TaxID=3364842 RepID=UPI0036ECD641